MKESHYLVLGNVITSLVQYVYCKIASYNTSRLEAHAGFFRLLMKEILGPFVL